VVRPGHHSGPRLAIQFIATWVLNTIQPDTLAAATKIKLSRICGAPGGKSENGSGI